MQRLFEGGAYDVIYSTKFWSNMMTKDVSQIESEMFDSLLQLFHNMNLTVLLPWQLTGFQTSPILKAFCPPLAFHFHISKWNIICMIQQAYKYVSPGMLPRLMFFELKITNILKSRGWGLEKTGLPWEQNFYSNRCVSWRTTSLPSFNGVHCKLAKIALFLYLI